MKTILTVLEQQEYDRTVFITYVNDQVIGINFHQGIGEILHEFSEPSVALTEIYNKILDSDSLKDRINKAIRLYLEAFHIQGERTLIPLLQRKLIQKALKFYVKCSDEINSDPTDEEQHDIYDMEQLDAMMNYDMSVSMSKDELYNFEDNHNINFPNYN
jgi:hypothetical protein